MAWDTFAARFIEELPRLERSKDAVQAAKVRISREVGATGLPTDGDLLRLMPPDLQREWAPVLRQKPMRTQSGVAVVAVMSSPAHCPHGKCVYCPGGPEVDAPQSYTGHEPSTMRARRLAYDPYRIVRTRLKQLLGNGHAVDKVDIVIQGGTFPARDPAYQDWFVTGIYEALNDGPGDGEWADEATWQAMPEPERLQRLDAAKQRNESATCRCIGLTIETKPDWCLEEHVDRMLTYGCTRVELGVQTLDEGVLELTHRGHGLAETRRAFQVAKDAGLKVCAHLMPGQPRPPNLATDAEADLEDWRRLFAEPAWRPDMLKVYPTLVVEDGETTLKKWWKEGRFTALSTEAAIPLVAAGKALTPPWCRIQRIDRDIPTTHVEAGIDKSNLRQLAQAHLVAQGGSCRCLRCREAGTRLREGHSIDPQRIQISRMDYEASEGQEVFLSLEDPEADAVVAYLRLRRVGPDAHRHEFQDGKGAAVVREVKVPGVAQPIGSLQETETDGGWQHRGHGARLLAEAEKIAFSEWSVGRLLVIAGVGVKAYYRDRGYEDLGAYVVRHD